MRQSGVHVGECVVINTSSLSSFVRTQCFDLSQLCFRHVYIPEGVCREFSAAFGLPRGLRVMTLTTAQKSRARALGLGRGESEAIILAMDMQAPLIMDDNPARRVAKKLGVPVIGSVGLVRIAFRECIIKRSNYESRIAAFEQSGRANAGVIAWARSARKP